MRLKIKLGKKILNKNYINSLKLYFRIFYLQKEMGILCVNVINKSRKKQKKARKKNFKTIARKIKKSLKWLL